MLRLDHVSVRVASLEAACAAFERIFGTSPARTPGVSGHARHFFTGSYVELREEPASVRTAEADVALWFLRFEDAEATKAEFARRGVQLRGPTTYEGLDGGRWEELHLDGAKPPLLPILVRRVYPEEVARQWPPPPPVGPLGHVSLGRIILPTRDVSLAATLLRPLTHEGLQGSAPDTAPLHFSFDVGGVTIHELSPEATPAPSLLFACESPSLVETHLRSRGVPFQVERASGRATLWVSPEAVLGLGLGFIARTESA